MQAPQLCQQASSSFGLFCLIPGNESCDALTAGRQEHVCILLDIVRHLHVLGQKSCRVLLPVRRRVFIYGVPHDVIMGCVFADVQD